jgi:hypothetical protein
MEKQVTKKKRAKKQKNDLKYYFDSQTQIAIVLFQTSTSKKEREKIYRTEIMPAFEKLVENLINIYKFSGMHDSYDSLKNDCVTFLFETINKFDESRGTTAFSYFNVVAKNWLIIKTKQKNSKQKKNISLDDIQSLTNEEVLMIESKQTVESLETDIFELESKNELKLLFRNLLNVSKSKNEILCINSIITILENIDDIDFINKNAIQLYIKELTGLNQKQLSSTFHNLRKNYKKIKTENLKNE